MAKTNLDIVAVTWATVARIEVTEYRVFGTDGTGAAVDKLIECEPTEFAVLKERVLRMNRGNFYGG